MSDNIEEPPAKILKTVDSSDIEDVYDNIEEASAEILRTKNLSDIEHVYEQLEKYIKDLNANNDNLIPIVDNSLNDPVYLVKIYVGVIGDRKDISKTIVALNEKLPLKQLQHLKRVMGKDVLLCPLEDADAGSIDEHLQVTIGDLKDVFEEFKVVSVPEYPPKVRKQFDEANKVWNCNFHPNQYNERIVGGAFFTPAELLEHRQYMAVVFEAAKYIVGKYNICKGLDGLNVSLVVDPSIQSVVAIAANDIDHPIKHSTMVAVDNVAATQNGGAWVAVNENQFNNTIADLYEHMKDKFRNLNFGARNFKSKKDMAEDEIREDGDLGPYLCTGYYLYSMREPCVMCSMGLVHARVKRVFFAVDNEELGGVKSKVKLQTVASLNHHFEVFTGFL